MLNHKRLLPGQNLLRFILSWPGYLIWRLRQLGRFGLAAVDIVGASFSSSKKHLVSRMFWGRGSLYKSVFHISVFSVTSLLLLSGLLGRYLTNTSSAESLVIAYGQQTNTDLLEQGGSLSTILPISPNQTNFKIIQHVVQPGDTVDSIAARYSVTKDTLKWSNEKILSPYNDNVSVGATLYIPEINGVLYEVRGGDNIDKVVALTLGNKFDIIELNGLVGPEYSLEGKQRIFVPDGKLPPPPPLIPIPGVYRAPSGEPCIDSGIIGAAIGHLPAGSFGDPLCASSCQGYGYSAGFSAWHGGVDLTHYGCPIRAAGAGKVVFAGWNSFGAGYSVIIDHGGGITTQYMHGDGNIWVRVGDTVFKGQDIMFMGNTGNSFGTHLHLTLKANGVVIDPIPYIPVHWYGR